MDETIKIENKTAYCINKVCNMLKDKGNVVTVNMLKNYIKRGHLKAIKINDKFYIKEDDIDWGMNAGLGSMEYFYTNSNIENKNQGIKQEIDIDILYDDYN